MKIIKLCWQHSVRMMLAAVAIFLSLHAHAQQKQGYAVLSADKTTLTFKYGTPTGIPNVDYYDTDNTLSKGDNVWGDYKENAQITLDILKGQKGPKRNAVVLNSAAGLYVAGVVESIKDGVKIAEEIIDSGKALTQLEKFIEFTNS